LEEFKMATSPAPVSIVKTIETDLKTHVFLALAALGVVVLLALGVVLGVEHVIGDVRAAADARDTQTLASVTALQKATVDRLAADETASAQRDAAYQKTIQDLATQLAARDAQSKKDQAQAQTLNAIDTAAAIATRTNAAPGEITAVGNTVVMDLPISRNVNSQLILLTQVQGDLKDTQTQLTATNGQLSDCRVTVADQKGVIANDAVVLAATKKKDADDLSVANNKVKKAGIKGFFAGVAAALLFVAGHAI
jgi:hypothetical protein